MGVSKVEYYGRTLMDTTETTVSEDTLMEGETAINAAGEKITGNLKAVQYKAQSPTAEEQAQARKNIDALGTEDLPEAINTGLAQAKESGEFDGKDGVDGQPGKDGSDGQPGKDGSDGKDGVDGVGIQSLEQVTASNEDGGSNVWRATLTNNETADFTVKNGSKGKQGDVGKTAYEYAKDGGYTGTEEDFIDLINTIGNKADNKHGHTWDEVGLIHYEGGSNTITSDDVIYNAYHKVCDNTPTLAEVQKGGTISYYNNGELVTSNFPEWYFSILSRTDCVVIAYDGYPFVVIALEDRITYNGNSFTRGTHFVQDSYFCVHSLTINNYEGFPYDEAQKIPSERLPEDIGSVKTVNNIAPDENGNISIDVGSGGGGGGSSVESWDDLALYDTVKDLTITSDDANYGGYHKVSDEAPTLAQLQKGGTVSFNEGGNGIVTKNYPEGDMAVMSATGGAVIAFNGLPLAVVAFEDGMAYMGNTFEKGISFTQDDIVITHSLTIKDYPAVGINPIPVEYLPESHQFGETTVMGDTITWDGDTEGRYNVLGMFYKVSDAIPTLADLQNGGTISYMNDTVPFTSDNIVDVESLGAGEGCIIITNVNGDPLAGVALKAGAFGTMEGTPITFEEAGVFFLRQQLSTNAYIHIEKLTINGYAGVETTQIKKIDTRFFEIPKTYFYGSGSNLYIDEEETTLVTTIDVKKAYDKGLIEVIRNSTHYMVYAVNFLAYPLQVQLGTSYGNITIGSAE